MQKQQAVAALKARLPRVRDNDNAKKAIHQLLEQLGEEQPRVKGEWLHNPTHNQQHYVSLESGITAVCGAIRSRFVPWDSSPTEKHKCAKCANLIKP